VPRDDHECRRRTCTLEETPPGQTLTPEFNLHSHKRIKVESRPQTYFTHLEFPKLNFTADNPVLQPNLKETT
jgi:hypothetical protein